MAAGCSGGGEGWRLVMRGGGGAEEARGEKKKKRKKERWTGGLVARLDDDDDNGGGLGVCVCVCIKWGVVTISLFDNGATFSCVSSCLEPCLVCFVAPAIVSGPGRRTSCIDRFTTTAKDFVPCRHICSMRLQLPLGGNMESPTRI